MGRRHKNFFFFRRLGFEYKSVKVLMGYIKKEEFSYLCVRNLNQVPVENLFCNIRQHDIANTNPTSFQFTAALKTVSINSISQPTSEKSNCEEDDCQVLDNLREFLTNNYDENVSPSEKYVSLREEKECPEIQIYNLSFQDSCDISSVAKELLASLEILDMCSTCQKALFRTEIRETDFLSLLDVTFNDQSDKYAKTYASKSVLLLIKNTYHFLWSFLQENGHECPLHDIFLQWFKKNCSAYHAFCKDHSCEKLIVEECSHMVIRKFVKENKVVEEEPVEIVPKPAVSQIPDRPHDLQIQHISSKLSTRHNKKMKKSIESKIV